MTGVLVIGSIAVDEVVRLAGPLCPGTHDSGQWIGERIGGGAANSAMALARAGVKVMLLSAVGSDAQGGRLIEQLDSLGCDTRMVDRGAPASTRSLVLLDPLGERTIINLSRARVPLPDNLDALFSAVCYVRSADPALTPYLAGRVERGELVVAHIPPLLEGLRPAQVLVGSRSDLPDEFMRSPYQSALPIAGSALEWMVVTDGANGATAFGPHGSVHTPAPGVEVIDSTGAGDSFAAGLCAALSQAEPIESVLQIAIHWGSASVQYTGTVPPPGFPQLGIVQPSADQS